MTYRAFVAWLKYAYDLEAAGRKGPQGGGGAAPAVFGG
jgi:hypothetical protein